MKTQEEIKKHKKKQNIISIVILILGTFLAYIFLIPSKSNISDGDFEIEEGKKPAIVKTEIISKDNNQVAQLRKTVTLEAGGKSAEVISEFSGRIKTVNFEVGEKVLAGQVLAVFDQSDYNNFPKISLESAENNYQISKNNLQKTKELVEKNEDLAKKAVEISKLKLDQTKDFGSDEEIEMAKKSLKISKDQEDQAKISSEIQINGAKIQLEQSKMALEQSRISYEKTIVKAPISGRIVSKDVNQEDFLGPGQKVASIIGEGNLEAKIFLNKNEIERIKLGDSVEIELGQEKYRGKINSYSKIADSSNGRFEVKIISEEKISEKANQTAQIVLNVYLNGSKESGFFVPLDAVNIGQNKKEVFVIENDLAVSKDVKLGEIIGTQIEILEGLQEGDELIIENSRNLSGGQSVRKDYK